MSDRIRPWCCCEKSCTPLINFHDHKDVSVQESGKSIFCWGKMGKNVNFSYDGIEHNNDLNFCVCTPLKGVVRLQTNKADWELLKIGCERGLEKLAAAELKSQIEAVKVDPNISLVSGQPLPPNAFLSLEYESILRDQFSPEERAEILKTGFISKEDLMKQFDVKKRVLKQDSPENLGKIFQILTQAWKQDQTILQSSNPKAVLQHPAYLFIVSQGKEMLPFILEDYRRSGGMWELALRMIVGYSPVRPESRGKADLIRHDWIQWGIQNCLIENKNDDIEPKEKHDS